MSAHGKSCRILSVQLTESAVWHIRNSYTIISSPSLIFHFLRAIQCNTRQGTWCYFFSTQMKSYIFSRVQSFQQIIFELMNAIDDYNRRVNRRVRQVNIFYKISINYYAIRWCKSLQIIKYILYKLHCPCGCSDLFKILRIAMGMCIILGLLIYLTPSQSF